MVLYRANGEVMVSFDFGEYMKSKLLRLRGDTERLASLAVAETSGVSGMPSCLK